jgi:hypothetical protein
VGLLKFGSWVTLKISRIACSSTATIGTSARRVPANPHLFLSSVAAESNFSRVALGAQHQIGTFFESDGATVIHPTPTELWDASIASPLPEDLFYLPRPR